MLSVPNAEMLRRGALAENLGAAAFGVETACLRARRGVTLALQYRAATVRERCVSASSLIYGRAAHNCADDLDILDLLFICCEQVLRQYDVVRQFALADRSFDRLLV